VGADNSVGVAGGEVVLGSFEGNGKGHVFSNTWPFLMR